MKKLLLAVCCLLATAGMAFAAEHVVEMRNKGEKGMMVFEPALVRAAPGDTVRFVAVDKGHNAETIKDMLPEGAASFKSKFNEDLTVTLDKEGVYGVKCAPHYGMGMVALIVAGKPVNAAPAEAVKHPGRAAKVFAELFGQAVAAK